MPVIGMMPIVIPTFSNTWNTNIDRTPTQISVPSGSRASWAVRQIRQAMIDSRAEQRAGADEAELLPHRREDEVGVLLGHDVEPGLGALEQAVPVSPPEPMAILACSRLYSAPRSAHSWFCVSRNDVSRHCWNVSSIPELRTIADADDADQRERDDVAHLRAADEQHPHDDGDEHEGGAEVGLQHDQPHRDARRPPSTTASRRASSSLLKCAIDRRQRDDHDDLGELGRLELERARAGTRPGCPCARCRAR